MTRRLRIVATLALAVLGLAAPVLAQQGRATGTVKDQNGKPIRAAIIKADNPNGYPSQVTATSDDKGRWAMIGLAGGEWRFTVDAPGFVSQSGAVTVRVGGTPPMTFVLPRDPGPVPGALEKNIQQQIAEAGALRDQGRLDQSLTAYQEIRSKNPKLTAVHFLLADVYRRKAAAERDPAAKRTLLEQAISSYNELLKADVANDRARAELESAQAEVAGANR